MGIQDQKKCQWKTQVQNQTALSSAEAEFIALSSGTQEIVYLSNLLATLNLKQDSVLILNDNQSCIRLASNDCGFSPRTKHINIRFHFIRDLVSEGAIKLKYVSTTKMIADGLTKPLSKHKLSQLCKDLGLSL